MARYAVISDIHGNRQAFHAVLDRIAKLGIDEIICLGDVVGYGPAPAECVDLVANYCSIAVRGNHEDAVLDLRLAGRMNMTARQAITWTRDTLGPLHLDCLNRMAAMTKVGNRVMCVHDCPVPGPTDYVHDKVMAAMSFSGVTTQVCLLGHTHVPMIFETGSPAESDGLTTSDVIAHIGADAVEIQLQQGWRYICNPGSVGQPRDTDPRASFGVLDLDASTFAVYREEYDIAAAQAEMEAAGLPMILADRLAIGA